MLRFFFFPPKGEETISSIESLRVTGCNKSLDDCAALCHDFILSCYYECKRISLIVDCFFLLRVAVQQRGYKTIYIRFTLGIGSDMPKR